MLLYDEECNDLIINYEISFDNESKEMVLAILRDCFNRREISLSCEEKFLLHKNFDLECLKNNLEKSNGCLHDLLVYYYNFSKPTLKKSEIGGIYLGEEVKVSSTVVKCSMSSTIAFILHHLNDEDRNNFINNLTSIEKTYINVLLELSGSERLSCLLDTIKNIEVFLKKCHCFEESLQLNDLKWFEKILYFKTVFNYATLTPIQSYNRTYLNSIIPIDDMEYEQIENIQDAAEENVEIIKRLKLEPKRIIY